MLRVPANTHSFTTHHSTHAESIEFMNTVYTQYCITEVVCIHSHSLSVQLKIGIRRRMFRVWLDSDKTSEYILLKSKYLKNVYLDNFKSYLMYPRILILIRMNFDFQDTFLLCSKVGDSKRLYESYLEEIGNDLNQTQNYFF